MQPVVYSELAAEQAERRGSEEVKMCYYQNLYRKNKNGKKGTSCFTVTWTDVHDRDDDRGDEFTVCRIRDDIAEQHVPSAGRSTHNLTVAPFEFEDAQTLVAVTAFRGRHPGLM